MSAGLLNTTTHLFKIVWHYCPRAVNLLTLTANLMPARCFRLMIQFHNDWMRQKELLPVHNNIVRGKPQINACLISHHCLLLQRDSSDILKLNCILPARLHVTWSPFETRSQSGTFLWHPPQRWEVSRRFQSAHVQNKPCGHVFCACTAKQQQSKWRIPLCCVCFSTCSAEHIFLPGIYMCCMSIWLIETEMHFTSNAGPKQTRKVKKNCYQALLDTTGEDKAMMGKFC